MKFCGTSFDFLCLPVVHEALEEFGGPEFVHLSDYTDAHIPVPTEQPPHMFTGSWRGKKKRKHKMGKLTGDIFSSQSIRLKDGRGHQITCYSGFYPEGGAVL